MGAGKAQDVDVLGFSQFAANWLTLRPGPLAGVYSGPVCSAASEIQVGSETP
jgi:hypothetical protein